MSVIDPRFDRRLRAIAVKRHYEARHMPLRFMSPDGQVTGDVVTATGRWLLRVAAFLVCVGVVFKIGVYSLAPSASAYQARIHELATGNPAQRSIAFVMQADPATVAVSEFLEGFFN